MLPLFAAIVAASTAVLIFAGGMVTSTGSGLSVPDWPNTYGWFMFSFPVDKWVGGIFYEHTHRLIASTVGFLILSLAFWLWRAEPRRWVRRLGFIALGAVITQGVLGGITVLWYLPDPISIAHASLAEIVFCLTVTIALVTSSGWKRGYVAGLSDDRLLQKIAIVTTATIYIQILLGATMRHTGAGLAIPDFPWMFGHVIPDHWDSKIAIHFAHRVGALCVTVLILATAGHVLYHHRRRAELRNPSILLLVLLPLQVTLGALTVLSGRQPIINSFHVVTGASVLVTSLVLTMRAHRSRFNEGAAGVRVPRSPRHPEPLTAHAKAGARA
ncbi:MAG TPA: COX15/CtaA family protein [Vicinamibacterales bacterium]|jgi:cytochrome c oxidase assembly protein subunit 15|nr:COX15/CtaA family protein [Vicinamibacterales bacterium]